MPFFTRSFKFPYYSCVIQYWTRIGFLHTIGEVTNQLKGLPIKMRFSVSTVMNYTLLFETLNMPHSALTLKHFTVETRKHNFVWSREDSVLILLNTKFLFYFFLLYSNTQCWRDCAKGNFICMYLLHCYSYSHLCMSYSMLTFYVFESLISFC